MTDVNAIRNNNLLLVNWLNGNDTTPIEQETSSSSNILPEIGKSVAYGAPFILGMNLLGQVKLKPVSVWQWKNNNPNPDGSKLSWSSAWEKYGEAQKAEKESLGYLKDENSWWKTQKNKRLFSQIKCLETEIPQFKPLSETEIKKLQGKDLIKYNNSVTKKYYYSEVRKLIEEAKSKKLTGQALKDQIKKIHEAMAKADGKVNLAIQQGLIKPTGKLGKVSHWIKSKSGVYSIKKSLLKSAKGGKALRMAAKGLKGTAGFALLEGLFEIGDIYNSYKKDRANGNRQLIKSAVKVAASVGGYALGSAAAGAAIGATVGSVCPIVGNIIGFGVGAAVGAVAGWLANKATKKVLGESQSLDKSEAELAKEAEAKKQADNATENIEEQKILLAEVAEKANGQGGFDDQALLDAYENILKEREAEIGGESSQEGAGSIESSETTLTQNQYDDETKKLLVGLSGIALNQVA